MARVLMLILIYVMGIGLIACGLFLLCHHGYTHMSRAEDKGLGEGEGLRSHGAVDGSTQQEGNDCCVPICFFRVSELYNHETWIVVCLLCGSTIMLMSLALQPSHS